MENILKSFRDVLARKQIGSFEIYGINEAGESLSVKDGKPETKENKERMAWALRVEDQGKMGLVYGTDWSESGFALLADQALVIAQSQPEKSFAGWAVDNPSMSVPAIEPAFETLTENQRWEVAFSLEKAALAYDKRIRSARYAAFESEKTEVRLLNSAGLDCGYATAGYSVTIMPIAEEEGVSESVMEFDFQRKFSDLNPTLLAQEAARKAVRLLGGERIPNFSGPIVLDRGIVLQLLEILVESVTLDHVLKKNSYLFGKKGEMVYSSLLNLIDDPHLFSCMGYAPMDDEGTPTTKTILIKKGVVEAFLSDRYWAQLDKSYSTGNGYRDSFKSAPTVSPSNLYLAAGDSSRDQLLSKMGDGVVITEAIGMHTADPISGDFSVGVQGMVVQNGVETKPFRSVTYTGNVHELLKGVIAVGSDLKFAGDMGASSLLIDKGVLSGE